MLHLGNEAFNNRRIPQTYTEQYEKTIVFSNPELSEIDMETNRSLISNDTPLNKSEILPAIVTSGNQGHLLAFQNLELFSNTMRDQWSIENNKTEWARVESLKKLYVAI